jgi:hypothetical protein
MEGSAMPQAIAAAVVAAIGATGVAATVVSIAVQLAVTLGLNFIAKAVFGSGVPKPSDGQQIIRESVASRRRHYGRVHVGGSLSFYESRNGTLAMVITTGTGRMNQIVEHRINGKPVAVGGGGVLSDAKFRGAIRILSRLGEDDQTAVSELTAIFPEWTADHRQRGSSLATILCAPVKQKYFSEVYEGNRQPEYTQVSEGALCYDPRKDSTAGGVGAHRLNNSETWEWTDNAALIIGDYWAHADGYGSGSDNVNWSNIAAEAAICDQMLTTVDAQTIARWRIWGSYSLATDERKTVLQEMLKACDGYCWQDADGKLNLHVGRWIEPTIHLNDNHIIALNGSMGAKATDRVNEVKIVYTDERFDFNEQESAPVVDLVAQTALGRPESQRFDIYYAPHHNQAVRLGKRLLAKLSDRWNLVVVTNLFGLNLIGERFCFLTCNELGIDAVAFEISALRIDFEAGTVEVGLSEVRASDWDFDAELEEGLPPEAPGDMSTPPIVPVPENMMLIAVPIILGEINAVGIKASWDEPAREGLSFIAEYRPTSGTWANMAVNQDEFTALSPVVDSAVEHEVRVKALTLSGRESDWTPVETITPSAPSDLASPSQLSATGGGAGEVVTEWRNPLQTSFDRVKLFRNSTNNLGTASQIGPDQLGALGEIMSYTATGLSAGTHYIWVRAYDAASNPSPAAGPVTVTI